PGGRTRWRALRRRRRLQRGGPGLEHRRAGPPRGRDADARRHRLHRFVVPCRAPGRRPPARSGRMARHPASMAGPDRGRQAARKRRSHHRRLPRLAGPRVRAPPVRGAGRSRHALAVDLYRGLQRPVPAPAPVHPDVRQDGARSTRRHALLARLRPYLLRQDASRPVAGHGRTLDGRAGRGRRGGVMSRPAPGAAPASTDAVASGLPASTPLYVAPPAGFAALRVVLLLPDRAPAWLLRFSRLAAASRWIEPVVVRVAGARIPALARVPPDVRASLAQERLRRRHQRDDDGALAAVPLGECATAAVFPPLSVDMPAAALRAAVSALRPDLVMLLGMPAWGEILAGCARSGCWVLDAGLAEATHGGLELFARLATGEHATELAFELVFADGQVERLATSWGSTRRDSFHEQRELAMRKLPALLLRAFRRLAAGGFDLPAGAVATLRLAPEPPVRAAGLSAFMRQRRPYGGRRIRQPAR